MNKKKISMVAGVLMAIFLVFMLKLNSDKHVFFDIEKAPNTLDPQLSHTPEGDMVAKNAFLGLYTTDKQGNLTLGAAKSHEISQEGKRHKFTLRENMLWSGEESKPVIADDFVYAFQRVVSPETKSNHAQQLSFVKNAKNITEGKLSANQLGVFAENDKTFILELDQVPTDLNGILAKAFLSPCNREFFASTKGAYGVSPNHIISNGSFYISGYKAESHITLSKQDNAVIKPKVSLVKFLVKPDKAERKKRFQEGITSVIYQDEKNEKSAPVEVERYSLLIQTKSEFLNQPSFREALIRAIDFEKLQEEFPDYFSLPTSIIPGFTQILSTNYQEFSKNTLQEVYQPQLAKIKYEEAVKKVGKQEIPLLIFAIEEGTVIEKISSSITQMWQKELGVFVNIQGFPPNMMEKVREKGEYAMMLYPVSFEKNDAVSVGNQLAALSEIPFPAQFFGWKEETQPEPVVKGLQQLEETIKNHYTMIPIAIKNKFFTMAKKFKGAILLESGLLLDFRYATV